MKTQPTENATDKKRNQQKTHLTKKNAYDKKRNWEINISLSFFKLRHGKFSSMSLQALRLQYNFIRKIQQSIMKEEDRCTILFICFQQSEWGSVWFFVILFSFIDFGWIFKSVTCKIKTKNVPRDWDWVEHGSSVWADWTDEEVLNYSNNTQK